MKIIAIKIGSGTLLTARHKPDEYRIAHIRDQVATLFSRGFGVVLVVSGAVACGMKHFDPSTPSELERQAAAGVGQLELMAVIGKIFHAKNMRIAQVLLTAHQLTDAGQREKVQQVLKKYLNSGIIAVINENDAVSLNGFGGNDLLVAEIAKLMRADKVLILSQEESSAFGVGGGQTKIEALSLLEKADISAAIVNGKEKNVILTNLDK